ncbi:MAG: tetratricopeptide repeat protein, partial [Candidatus Methylomirabilis sp.]|nr:tetratricopeptide repeat protein [Deltaproteobacteria bacterium]
MTTKIHSAAALSVAFALLAPLPAARAEDSSERKVDSAREDLTFLGYSTPAPPAALARAVEAYRAGRFYVALIELRDLLSEEAPGLRPDLWFYLAETSLEIGLPEEALPNFWKVAEAPGGPRRNPFFGRAVLEIARLNFRWGEHGAVASLYDRFGQRRALESEFHYIAGESLVAVGRREEGEKLLDGLAFAGPFYPYGQYSLAQDDYVRGDYEAALARFENAERAPGPSGGGVLLRERARLATGQILYQLGRYDRAVDAFYRIGRESPQYWKARLGLGWCYMKTGDFPMAIAYFEEIVDSRPKDPSYGDAYLDLGRAYIRVALYDDATKLFKKSVAVMSGRAEELRAAYGAAPVTAALVQDLVGYRIAAEPYLRRQEAEIKPLERKGGTGITNLVDAAAVYVFQMDEKEVTAERRASL